MLDFNLATLYETETRTLKQAVRRNIDKFPEDFMFPLSKFEWNELITNCDNLRNYKFAPPLHFPFTGKGMKMLATVFQDKIIILRL